VSVSERNTTPLLLQAAPQFDRVLDDPVVDHGDATGGVAMGVGVEVAGLAMGGPAGVGDAQAALHLHGQQGLQFANLALLLVHLQGAVAGDGQAGGVIAAVFQAAQPLHQDRHGVLRADISDDPAH
jgi:hypothetical protein